jgi:hypothetical protein
MQKIIAMLEDPDSEVRRSGLETIAAVAQHSEAACQ